MRVCGLPRRSVRKSTSQPALLIHSSMCALCAATAFRVQVLCHGIGEEAPERAAIAATAGESIPRSHRVGGRGEGQRDACSKVHEAGPAKRVGGGPVGRAVTSRQRQNGGDDHAIEWPARGVGQGRPRELGPKIGDADAADRVDQIGQAFRSVRPFSALARRDLVDRSHRGEDHLSGGAQVGPGSRARGRAQQAGHGRPPRRRPPMRDGGDDLTRVGLAHSRQRGDDGLGLGAVERTRADNLPEETAQGTGVLDSSQRRDQAGAVVVVGSPVGLRARTGPSIHDEVGHRLGARYVRGIGEKPLERGDGGLGPTLLDDLKLPRLGPQHQGGPVSPCRKRPIERVRRLGPKGRPSPPAPRDGSPARRPRAPRAGRSPGLRRRYGAQSRTGAESATAR